MAGELGAALPLELDADAETGAETDADAELGAALLALTEMDWELGRELDAALLADTDSDATELDADDDAGPGVGDGTWSRITPSQRDWYEARTSQKGLTSWVIEPLRSDWWKTTGQTFRIGLEAFVSDRIRIDLNDLKE